MQIATQKTYKLASLGGRGNDAPFEQAFASIAHSYLQDVAPMLLDYELGFQLLDRNQDDTQAVGIMGFKLGSQLLYAPVFFINNELKGHELLYVKNEDRFIPLKENWVKYLLGKKPMRLGNGTSRMTRQDGVRQPNYNRLRMPPGKYASAKMPEWVQGYLPKYAAAKLRPSVPKGADLPAFLKQAGRETVVRLCKTAAMLPAMARGLERFHGLNMIRDVMAEIKAEEIKQAAERSPLIAAPAYAPRKVVGSFFDNPMKKTADVRIHTHHSERTSLLPSMLSADQKEHLWKFGVLIEDKRIDADISTLYKSQFRQTLRNPSNSGIYDVLTRDGGESSTDKCVVLYNPYTCGGERGWCTVIRLSDKSWSNENPSNVYVTKEYDGEDWNKWVEGLDNVGTLTNSRSVIALVRKDGLAVSPFSVDLAVGDAAGAQTYDVDFKDTYCCESASLGGTDITRPSSAYVKNDGRLRIDDKENTGVRKMPGSLVLPNNMKKLTLHQDDQLSYAAEACQSPNYKARIRLGDMSDIQAMFFSKTAGLKIWSDGTEVEINGSRMTKMAGLVQLVKTYGLREHTAREAIKEAETSGAQSYRIKLADMYADMIAGAPGAPAIPEPMLGEQQLIYGGSVPSMEPQPEQIPVSDMMTDPSNVQFYDPTEDLQQWNMPQAAAEAGQQDVFDAATIGSLLKTHRDDGMIDQHITGLMDGLNRAGTLLFLFYAHNDQYEERYGKSEMPELEDSLRTTFENLGDLCLFLKQKTIEASGEDTFDISLDGISAEG